jgi:hypothetical protein
VKLVLGILVVILTLFSFKRPRQRIAEINLLPRNRSEIDSIESSEILLGLNGTVYAIVRLKYIFYITYLQHFEFLQVLFSAARITISLNFSHALFFLENDEIIKLAFDPPVTGPVLVELYRSRTLLASRNLDITVEKKNVSGLSRISSEIDEEGRHISNITNSCWSSDTFEYFTNIPWSIRTPFISWSDFGGLLSRRGNVSFHLNARSPFLVGTSAVVGLPADSPYDWGWMKRIASSVISLCEHFDHVLTLRKDQSTYFSGFKSIIPVMDDVVCCENANVQHLRSDLSGVELFRNRMMENVGARGTKTVNKTIILKSKIGTFNVTGLKKVAREICPDCDVEVVYGEGWEPLDLILNMSMARFVFAPYSGLISQALWMRGTLFEFIPEGSECREWTYEVSNQAGIDHIRIAVGNDTKIVRSGNVQCEPGFEKGLAKSVVTDVRKVVDILNGYLNQET